MIDAIYSDPHFGHRMIAEEIRMYPSPDVMNEDLIEWYNGVVRPNQTCLWLGDAFLTPMAKAEGLMKRLNGTKYLVLGNHDKNAARMAKLGFSLVSEELVLFICGRVVRANHYPHWDPHRKVDLRHFENLDEEGVAVLRKRYTQRRKGELLIHGHIHGQETVYQNMINFSADAWNLSPVKWEKVEELVRHM